MGARRDVSCFSSSALPPPISASPGLLSALDQAVGDLENSFLHSCVTMSEASYPGTNTTDPDTRRGALPTGTERTSETAKEIADSSEQKAEFPLSVSMSVVSRPLSGVLVGWPQAAGTPRFSGQPEGAVVRTGDSQVLGCEVNADLVSFVRWERDREPVEAGPRVYTLPSGTLVVSNATEADAGTYRCVLENAGPTKTSEEAELQVLPETWAWRQLEFLQQPGPTSRAVGEGAVLPCVVSGYPPAYVRWTHDGDPVDESDGRFLVLGGGSLQIFNLTEEDAGIYFCLADNANDSIEAQTELTVQELRKCGRKVSSVSGTTTWCDLASEDARALFIYPEIKGERESKLSPFFPAAPPQFLKRPADTYAREAADVLLECEVAGSPAPTIRWLKNGDAVIPSDYFRIVKEQNLQVLGLVKSDEGFYQCLVENEAGNSQASAQLIILDQACVSMSAVVPGCGSVWRVRNFPPVRAERLVTL
ncbi:hypothetical protein P4O66_000502 [Electrophorus voltai]|uniref:Ig-like domain-containing protein n=1 Tax=Electrophorus voltai TaxID=2609070 RepID=A0AAD8ZFD3_9TELE|nr:hypothetical protein P4O66_000502 [Electrophorus voltai]